MAPIRKILVANRGEIACRVIRTAQSLGIGTVAVCSSADRDAPHAKAADQLVEIGPAPVAESYLNADAILAAARETGADAIHPGYGFLSENADFAERVGTEGFVFIGAPPAAIRAMGNKAEAKRLMQRAGVPCVPGYEGKDQSEAAFARAAQDIGFPIMVKAAAGGGGRGMRLVERPADLPDALARARSEAENAFGSGELILERAVIAPRHVEVQVMADAHGTVLHLYERDCSVQRRHQKVIEEAPCPVMTPELRDAMTGAAIEAARAVDYRGAGTVEFLLSADDAFYFLEMNTRLQVEHPVTEMVTGLDLVALQIAVAAGEPLPLSQDAITLEGHAIEARLYAEDPAAGYLPTTGRIVAWKPPFGDGIRCDDGISTGSEVSPYYDPMLAKISAHGPDRATAIARLHTALGATVLLGPRTNRGFLAKVLELPDFRDGAATTGLLTETWPDGYPADATPPEATAIAAWLWALADRDAARAAAPDVPDALIGWNSAAPLPVPITLQGKDTSETVDVIFDGATANARVAGQWYEIRSETPDNTRVTVNGHRRKLAVAIGDRLHLSIGTGDHSFTRHDPLAARGLAASGNAVVSPMPGQVISVATSVGATVEAGETLAVIEAMKMQHPVRAPRDGRVKALHVAEGDQIAGGAVLVELEE